MHKKLLTSLLLKTNCCSLGEIIILDNPDVPYGSMGIDLEEAMLNYLKCQKNIQKGSLCKRSLRKSPQDQKSIQVCWKSVWVDQKSLLVLASLRVSQR